MSLGVLLVAVLALRMDFISESKWTLYLNQKIPVSVDLYALSLLTTLQRGCETWK